MSVILDPNLALLPHYSKHLRFYSRQFCWLHTGVGWLKWSFKNQLNGAGYQKSQVPPTTWTARLIILSVCHQSGPWIASRCAKTQNPLQQCSKLTSSQWEVAARSRERAPRRSESAANEKHGDTSRDTKGPMWVVEDGHMTLLPEGLRAVCALEVTGYCN